jgi:hypothetical protein
VLHQTPHHPSCSQPVEDKNIFFWPDFRTGSKMAQLPIDFAIPPFGTPDSRRLGATLTFMAMDAADLTAAVVMEKWFDLKSAVFDAQYVDIMITGKLLSIYVAILYNTTAHHNVTPHHHTTSSHHIITPHHHTTSSHHIITKILFQ